jgi:hypothetical protein
LHFSSSTPEQLVQLLNLFLELVVFEDEVTVGVDDTLTEPGVDALATHVVLRADRADALSAVTDIANYFGFELWVVGYTLGHIFHLVKADNGVLSRIDDVSSLMGAGRLRLTLSLSTVLRRLSGYPDCCEEVHVAIRISAVTL